MTSLSLAKIILNFIVLEGGRRNKHHNIDLDLVWFYDITTIVGRLMQNQFYTNFFNIYDLVWLAFLAYQPV